MAQRSKSGKAVAAKPQHESIKPAPPQSFPTPEQILDFIRSADETVGKREIARAFGITGDGRVKLKQILGELSREGKLAGNRREFREKGALPPVATVEVIARDGDGELIAEPVVWDNEEA